MAKATTLFSMTSVTTTTSPTPTSTFGRSLIRISNWNVTDMNDRYSPGIPLYIFLISDICYRHGLKQGLIHGNLVADGWAGAVMRKPIAIQFFFGPTDRPTRQGVESRVRD